jgi:hypothetical protein
MTRYINIKRKVPSLYSKSETSRVLEKKMFIVSHEIPRAKTFKVRSPILKTQLTQMATR